MSLDNDIGPENSIMINRGRILHRFKLRQNAPLDNLFIINVLSNSNFQNTISIAVECTS